MIYKLRLEIGSDILYHDARHTMDVIQSVERIALDEKVDERSVILLKIAALFHDTGYLFDSENHEARSVELFRDHALGYSLDESALNTIEELIRVTCIPQLPQNHLQSIICDADLDYLGRRDFAVLSEFLYLEFLCQKRVKNRETWNQMQVQFLESHQYHTEYARKNRDTKKIANLAELKHRMGMVRD